MNALISDAFHVDYLPPNIMCIVDHVLMREAYIYNIIDLFTIYGVFHRQGSWR